MNTQIEIQNDVKRIIQNIVQSVQLENKKTDKQNVTYKELEKIADMFTIFGKEEWGAYKISLKVELINNVVFLMALFNFGYWALIADESDYNSNLLYKDCADFIWKQINNVADINIDYLVGKGTAEEFNKINNKQNNERRE